MLMFFLPDMKQQLKEYKLGKGVAVYVCIHEGCVWRGGRGCTLFSVIKIM